MSPYVSRVFTSILQEGPQTICSLIARYGPKLNYLEGKGDLEPSPTDWHSPTGDVLIKESRI
jgi:hypothetical protein